MSGLLALVPARGGSKRLPGKNLRPLAGRPLIAHTIGAALGCPDVERVVVSTDDEAIAEAARAAGAEVPFLRPAHLATDAAGSMDVVFHVLAHLRETEGYRPSSVALLQPTSPLRTSAHLAAAVALHRSSQPPVPVISVVAAKPPSWLFAGDAAGALSALFPRGTAPAAPEGGALWLPNGALYLASMEDLEAHRGFLRPGTRGYPMEVQASVDIDTLDDFRLAEACLRLVED